MSFILAAYLLCELCLTTRLRRWLGDDHRGVFCFSESNYWTLYRMFRELK